jgi:hypothetical protein
MAQRIAAILLVALALSACTSRSGPGGGSPESAAEGCPFVEELATKAVLLLFG